MLSLIFYLICVVLHLLSNIECWICVSQNYHCEQWYWCGWVGFIMVTILSDYLAMMVCRISPISYWLNTAHDNLSVPNCQAPSPLGVPKCVLYGPTYSNLSGTTLVWLCLHTGAIKQGVCGILFFNKYTYFWQLAYLFLLSRRNNIADVRQWWRTGQYC